MSETAQAQQVVMMDSPEAASLQTVTGWVSRDGFFYGKDERIARYAGCTHRACEECGAAVEKAWLTCPTCRQKKVDARWIELERKPWDGETPMCLYDGDTYFFDMETVEDYCEDHGIAVKDLRLVFCEPVKPGQIEANELFFDELPEDGEVEDEDVLAAVAALNAALKKADPFSWRAGSVAVELAS